MKKLLLFLTCLMTSLFVFPQIAFERTYGGTGYDNGLSVLQTSDGGYAILGITNSSLVHTPTKLTSLRRFNLTTSRRCA